MKNFGKCIIFSAPSGSGKTTLVRELLEKSELNLSFSISATTRNKRQGEINGKDYFFKSKSDFKELIKNNQFLEFEEVYEDVFYGSLKEEVNKLLETSNVIFDIDVIGGIKLKNFFQHDALAVFVKPPSIEELRKRLVSRALPSCFLNSINSLQALLIWLLISSFCELVISKFCLEKTSGRFIAIFKSSESFVFTTDFNSLM